MNDIPTDHRHKTRHPLLWQILSGAFWCNAGLFLVAPVVALLYQFPASPYGKVGGTESFANGWDWLLEDTIGAVWITQLFAMLFGGALVLTLLGGLAGAVTFRVFGCQPDKLRGKTIIASLLINILIAVLLALAADALAPYLEFGS